MGFFLWVDITGIVIIPIKRMEGLQRLTKDPFLVRGKKKRGGAYINSILYVTGVGRQ